MLETSFMSFFNKASEQIILKEQAEGVLTHLTHLEELVLTTKKQGLDIAINFLNQLYEVLKGKTDSKTFVTIKIDGAPAVTAGINPENGKFFVGTKSIANVNPKVNYTNEDIDKNHGHAPGLVNKLKLALKYLPSVIREGVYQGDFLFDQQDLQIKNIDGEDLILFKPNTITYAVDQHSAFGQRILNSKIGIIFHTKYTGSSLQDLKKSSDVSVSEFNQTQDVFVDDAKFKDISGLATFTKDESDKFESLIDACQTAGNKINWEEIPETIYTNLNIFINSLIRQGRFVEKPQEEYNNFIQWVNQKGQKAVEQLKSEKGKQKKQQALNDFIATIEQNQKDVLNLFNLSKKLEQAKMMFVNKYNSVIKTKQFLTQPDGSLKVTAPEGYVAVDNTGNMTKFIDRLSFSAANFSISKAEKFK